MAAAALPIALVFGILADLVSGLVSRPSERPWWRRVTGVGPDVLLLVRDRKGRERVSVVEAGGAAAAMLGSGTAAAGALGVGPDDMVLLYLALAVASVGALVVGLGGRGSREAGARNHRLLAAAAEPAFAVGMGVMFLRYGALDVEAVRGTQQVLGTGVLLLPGLATAGLTAAALAFAAAGALRLQPSIVRPAASPVEGAGPSVLARLCRWSLAGATALIAGVLLAGGGLEPLALEGILPAALGALGVAVAIGVADAFLARLTGAWRLTATGIALVVAVAAAAMVVLA
jgi:hypothetical protein